MPTPSLHKLFRKDVERDKNSGKYKKVDFDTLKKVMELLSAGESLDQRFKDHALDFEWSGYRECHIKPNWLLIYKVVPSDNEIIFARLGTHTQVFDGF